MGAILHETYRLSIPIPSGIYCETVIFSSTVPVNAIVEYQFSLQILEDLIERLYYLSSTFILDEPKSK